MQENIIPINFDPIFKAMFGSDKYINILESLISIYFSVPIEKLKGKVAIMNSEKRITNKNDKEQTVDIIARVITTNTTMSLNLEMNKKLSQGLIDRNLDYLTGIFYQGIKRRENYNDIISSIQVNFNLKEVDPNNTDIIDKYYMRNRNGFCLTEKFQSHQVNIVKCYDIWYNGRVKEYDNKTQDIIRIGAIIFATKKDEFLNILEEMNMEDEVKNDIEKLMNDMNSDDLINMYYNQEQHDRAVQNTLLEDALEDGKKQGIEIGTKQGIEIGTKQGEKSKQIEIAKKLLESNIDENIILKTTGLTKEELDILN